MLKSCLNDCNEVSQAPACIIPAAGAAPPNPKPGALAAAGAPNAGVLAAPNAGALLAPKAGVLAAPKAGVLAAPKAGAPKAGALEGVPNAGAELVVPNPAIKGCRLASLLRITHLKASYA
jgi:hypothetical protein